MTRHLATLFLCFGLATFSVSHVNAVTVDE